jgi:hypothetical protein
MTKSLGKEVLVKYAAYDHRCSAKVPHEQANLCKQAETIHVLENLQCRSVLFLSAGGDRLQWRASALSQEHDVEGGSVRRGGRKNQTPESTKESLSSPPIAFHVLFLLL